MQQDREQNEHELLYCLMTRYVDYKHDRVNKKHLARFSIVQFSLVRTELLIIHKQLLNYSQTIPNSINKSVNQHNIMA